MCNFLQLNFVNRGQIRKNYSRENIWRLMSVFEKTRQSAASAPCRDFKSNSIIRDSHTTETEKQKHEK